MGSSPIGCIIFFTFFFLSSTSTITRASHAIDHDDDDDVMDSESSGRHTQRIADLVKGNNVYYGGDYDVDRHYFQPTLVDNPKLDSKLMSEEIFGPVLPFIPFDDVDDAIKIIKQRAKPLALYIFSQDTVTRVRFFLFYSLLFSLLSFLFLSFS